MCWAFEPFILRNLYRVSEIKLILQNIWQVSQSEAMALTARPYPVRADRGWATGVACHVTCCEHLTILMWLHARPVKTTSGDFTLPPNHQTCPPFYSRWWAEVSGRCGRLLWSQPAVMNCSRQDCSGAEARQAKPSGLVIVQVDVIKRHYHI